MIRVRNFEYTFRALCIEPTVRDFRRFYQMTVLMGFFSFHQRDGSPKLMVPPKGMTKWKTQFFYIKAAAVTAKLAFRNVTDTIITETITIPHADTVDWFPRLRIIGWKKLSNSQLWVLRMMLGRVSRKARPVVWEKSGEDAPFWRIFDPGFKGKVEVLACADGEEGFNFTIRDNFRLPEREAMQAELPQGKEPQEESFSLFDVPFSPPRDAPTDAGVNKEFRRSPSIEVVTPPSARAEDIGKKAAGQTIVDTVDSSDNLIEPRDADVEGVRNRSPLIPKSQTPLSPRRNHLVRLSRVRRLKINRPFSLCELSSSPWTVMQADDISIDPSACKDILSGLGTPFEVLHARGLPRENRINQLSSMLVGSSIMANAIIEGFKVLGRKEEEIVHLRAEAEATARAAREGAEQLKKDRAAFEKLKQTEAWAATTGLKQVRTLAKLLSDERKSWKEACARENEKFFRIHQELTNLKAANASLIKERVAAEAASKETKEAEARSAKALEEATADRNNLNKVVEDFKNRVPILEEVTARTSEAEARAREVAEARDSLTTSLDQLKADRNWMRDHGIGHIF
ncbi:hypothetical protein Hdeb2414_s0012g00393821 [Helianthus debilis subsp. tardiflorus]